MTIRHGLIVCALTAAALGTVYLPHVQSAPFVYEDVHFVDRVPDEMNSTSLKTGRGLMTKSWTVIRTPIQAHALNLALHSLVVLLAGLLVWTLTTNGMAAVGVGAVMALHPMTMEGVAYAASRGELLMTSGVLLAVLSVTAGPAWLWAGLPLALGLAYVGKETGIVAVALIPLAFWLQGARTAAARWTWALCGCAAAVLLWRPTALREAMHFVTGEESAITFVDWGLTQSVALARLGFLSLAPLWPSITPDVAAMPSLVHVSAIILLLASAECVWRVRHVAPLATFGACWALVAVAPRFIVRTPWSPLNDHQWYLSMVGVACVIVAGAQAVDAWVASCKREWPCPA